MTNPITYRQPVKSNLVDDSSNNTVTSRSGATEVSTYAALKAAIGYDDGAGTRVAGSEDGGTISITSGTYEAGTDILWPDDDTTVLGAGIGSTIINGRMFCDLTAATNTLHLEDFTVNTGTNTKNAFGAADSQYGTCIFQNGLISMTRVKFVGSTTTNSENLVTFVDTGVVTDVTLRDCVYQTAEADIVSTKGPTAGTVDVTAGTTFSAFNCSFTGAGSGANDQAITGHNAWPMYVHGCEIKNSATTVSAKAVETSGTSTDLELYGCEIEGAILGFTRVVGCKITFAAATSSPLVSDSGTTDIYFIGNYVSADASTDSDNKILTNASGGTQDIYVQSNYFVMTTAGFGDAWVPTAFTGTAYYSYNNISGARRAIDARSPTTVEAYNNIISASSFHFLDDGDNALTTKNNILVETASTSNYTKDATDLDATTPELNNDGRPIQYGNCDGTGDASAVTGASVGLDVDFRGGHREWKTTVSRGPIELPVGYVEYDRANLVRNLNLTDKRVSVV